MNRLKLVVVGPTKCGKSYLCNFLSESVEQVTEEYRPTCGVRFVFLDPHILRISFSSIIEYELNTTIVNKPCKVELELWDLSGNRKYENCWPACFKGSHGAIFVYNPDHSEHIKELEDWHMISSRNMQLKESSCCVISNKKSNAGRDAVSLPSALERFQRLTCSFEEAEKLRDQFEKFISQLIACRHEATEQEELNIINT
ncbi:hypothetical protein P879_06634 [Paragonimus westermani]|uniref:Intraflagellar transport protein 22 n=1 Tax=Paragonimus westermani TaxID=34504 RepID=A0A8T0DD24_9TREM|nr:hypothetical protein P879_06634 [Paragonimus westermani]